MVMIFKSDKARKYLLQNGIVFTFRVHRRKKLGKDWINDGRGRPKIADVVITEFREIRPLDFHVLSIYVEWSGFNSVEEWEQEIQNFNKGKHPVRGWLYLVTLRECEVK